MNDETRVQHDDGDREWAGLFRRTDGGAAGCPSPDLIQAARADVLPDAVGAAVSTHIAGCTMCRVLAESFDAIVLDGPTTEESARMHARIRTAAATASASRRRYRWWIPIAASLLLTATVVAWWSLRSPRNTPASSVFHVDTNVVLPLESALKPTEATDLAVALLPYRAGRFDDATKLLTTYTAIHPQNAYGFFYLGVARLAQQSDREAIAALESADQRAAASPLLRREVSWHLAIAYRRLGRNDEAWPLLANLCEGRLARACAGLREIATVVTIRGVVTDAEGRTLQGVRVMEHVFRNEADFLVTEPTRFSASTDAGGRFVLDGTPESPGRRLLLRASRPGYFTANASLPYTPDGTANFVLHPWRVVAIGENIQSRTAQGALCDPSEYCQRYAVTPNRTGVLEVSVPTTRNGLDLYVEAPDGRVYGPHMGAPLRLTFPVTAGSTLQIRVLDNRQPGDFELRTVLR